MAAPPPDDKPNIKLVNNFVKASGWRSMNDFIVDFFNSSEGAPSLRYIEGKTYGPARILNAWTISVPSNESRSALNESITKKAAEILVAESSAVIHNKTLQVSSSGLTIPFLTNNFGLTSIWAVYKTLLPCLILVLTTLLTALNNYERKHSREKFSKDDMARQVSFCLINFKVVV